MTSEGKKLGLVLSGGGARAAYQVGVLKALLEKRPDIQFHIVTGFSAGAINASFVASECQDMPKMLERLERLWGNIRPEDVFRTDPFAFLKNGLRLIWDLSFGGLHRHTGVRSLLDTDPLRRLLKKHSNYESLGHNIENDVLDAFAVSATDYGSAESVCFYQSKTLTSPWVRKRRRAEPVNFGVEHIMASSAIPVLFPSIQIGDRFYGDGCLRNAAPLSPAIHLGADRLLIVGVRRQREATDFLPKIGRPGLGRVFGVVLNAILLDTTDMDVERMARINQTISLLSEEEREKTKLRNVDFSWITPSVDLGELAKDFTNRLPAIIRYLLRGLGTKDEFSEIASYLLFDKDFCRSLIDLGYQDGKDQADSIDRLLS